MDLKGNKITVGQLLDDPRSRKVLLQYVPLFLKHPMLTPVRKMSLEEVMAKAKFYIPKSQILHIIGELEKA